MVWPLTGRSEEMRVIKAALTDRDRSGIVVCGAAGIGKSRIVRDALTAAQAEGYEMRWVVGTFSAQTLPLGALASWVGRAEGDSLQLVRRVIASLTSASPGTPVIVGVDDVHLLDDLSTFVVQQIVQRGAAKVVLTVRDGETIPAGVQQLWADDRFERLDLQPLSHDETTALVEATLGGPLDLDAARRLWKLTHGNVLYLRNIVEQEVADERLVEQRGLWRWVAEPVVSPSLVELIESRMGALPVSVSDVIDVLAVGEPLDLASLTRITDSVAVEQAETRGLITVERGDGEVVVRLSHPIYGEVRRQRAPATRLRRFRGRVAAELAKAADADDMRLVMRRAALIMDSDVAPDPDVLVWAAQGAVWFGNLPLADRLSDAALRAGGGAEAHVIRSNALVWLGRGREADAVLASIPTDHSTDTDRARIAFLRADNMMWQLADPTGAKTLIDAVEFTTESARAYIDAFYLVYWAVMGRPDAARQISEHLVQDNLPTFVGAVAAAASSLAAGQAGRASEAVSAAVSGYAVATQSFDAAHMRFPIADANIDALILAGRIEEACDFAEGLRRQEAELFGPGQLLSAAAAGRVALAAGNLDDACALLGPVVDTFTAMGNSTGLDYRYGLPHTIALAMRGEANEAGAGRAALEMQRHPTYRHLHHELALAHAWVAAGQGAVSEAIKTVLAAAETCRANGQFASEVLCLQTAAQFGDRSCATRLRELERIVEGPRVDAAARLANAWHTHNGAELATVSEEFEAMGDLVAAVDAAAQAAIVYRRQDRRGSGLGCSTRAEELAERCGGANTPALRQATERLPLSDREREVVMLVAEGLSSPEIAERLTLSKRTVEGHIYHAMTKTGVSSREELAALLPARRSRDRK